MPPQLRQDQPVYFVDAYGKETAFYLDFVFSSTVSISINYHPVERLSLTVLGPDRLAYETI